VDHLVERNDKAFSDQNESTYGVYRLIICEHVINYVHIAWHEVLTDILRVCAGHKQHVSQGV
jgi:hypothetical protein